MEIIPYLEIIRESLGWDGWDAYRFPGLAIVVKKRFATSGPSDLALYDESTRYLLRLIPHVGIVVIVLQQAQQYELEQYRQALDSPSPKSSSSGNR